jgi:hypothetical protein
MNGRRLMSAAVLLGLIAAAPAHAGRNCEARPASAWSVQRSLDLADRTAQALDATGAQVVVLARAGQDLSRYHLRWSHLGLAYRVGDMPAPAEAQGKPTTGKRTPPAARRGVWRVVHKLNQCGSDRADLFRQGLGEFFMDDLFDYEAAFVVPDTATQKHLQALLGDNGRVRSLHTPAYNMLAYPWAQTYQQSNQWAIETLACAEESGACTRERAQAWLRFKGYEPTVLRISPLARLGARLTAANIAFDDHPNSKRFANRIETVTVDSVFDWLARSGLSGPVQVQR